MKSLKEIQFDAFFARIDQGELIPVPIPEEGPMMTCPKCGAEEIEASSPRTTYSCGSSDYDQRPDTFQQSTLCKQRQGYVEPIRIAEKLEIQIGMLNGRHNREFCLHTTNHYGLIRESESDGLTPFWTTRLKTEELMELRDAISEALLIASRFE